MPKSFDEYFHNWLRLSFLFIRNLNDELMHAQTFDIVRSLCSIFTIFSSCVFPILYSLIYLLPYIPILSLCIYPFQIALCRSTVNEYEDSINSEPEFNFDKLIDTKEVDIDDSDLPQDLLRLVEQEERQIVPHKEITELINLGTEEDRREVKIGTTLSETERQQLIDLLKEYSDVFA